MNTTGGKGKILSATDSIMEPHIFNTVAAYLKSKEGTPIDVINSLSESYIG
jgi:hypothetical protein